MRQNLLEAGCAFVRGPGWHNFGLITMCFGGTHDNRLGKVYPAQSWGVCSTRRCLAVGSAHAKSRTVRRARSHGQPQDVPGTWGRAAASGRVRPGASTSDAPIAFVLAHRREQGCA